MTTNTAVPATTVDATTVDTASSWTLDPSHSTIGFSVKHFFTPVHGRFDRFEATVEFDPSAPSEAFVELEIDVSSINTNDEQRDAHLLSGDFFNAEDHGRLTFRSKAVREIGEGAYAILGDLTIKGVTREVDVPVELLGITEVPESMREAFGGIQQVASFEGGLTIDRKDFGVGVGSWAATLVVGGEVEIRLALEANR